MAYTPTLADIDRLDKENEAQTGTTPSGYTPTLADLGIATPGMADAPGLSPEQAFGDLPFLDKLERVGEDIISIPGAIYEMGKGTAEELYDQPAEAGIDLAEGAVKALGQMTEPLAEGAAATPGLSSLDALQYMLPQSMQEELAAGLQYEPERPGDPATRLGEFGMQVLPIGKVGSLTENLMRIAMEALPSFFGKKLATGVAAGAAAGTAMSPLAGFDPEEGAMLGALTPTDVIPYGRVLRSVVRGRASPEQMRAAEGAIPKGLKMPIGDIANSPAMRRLYSLSQSLLGSGANKPYELLNKTMNEVKDVFQEDLGVSEKDANELVYDEMLEGYQDSMTVTNDAYTSLGNLADEKDLPFDSSALNKTTETAMKELNKKMITTKAKELYQPAYDLLADFNNLPPMIDFSQAIEQLPVINDILKDASSGNNKPLMRSAMTVKKGLQKSIDDSAKNHPVLLTALTTAKDARKAQGKFEKLNKRDKTPFYKTYLKDGDPGKLISQYLKPSKKTDEMSGLLEQMTKFLPEEAKKAVGEEYFKDTTLSKFLKKTEDLSEKQRELLFGEEKAQTLQELDTLADTVPESRSAAFDPKTGYQSVRGFHAGMTIPYALYKLFSGDPTEAAFLAFGGPVLGQLLQRGLRSDKLKEAYIKAVENEGQLQEPDTQLRNVLRLLGMGDNEQ